MRLASKQEDSFFSFKNPIKNGILGTFSLFGIYAWLAISRSCQKGVCQSNYKHFLASSPNEIGDTLAGIAGILAFLWIIVTVFLQSRELREQRVEFKQQRLATQDMARTMNAQAFVFEDEMAQRMEKRAKELIDQKIVRIRILAKQLFISVEGMKDVSLHWIANDRDTAGPEHLLCDGLADCFITLRYAENLSGLFGDDERLKSFSGLTDELHGLIFDIFDVQYELSPGQVQRIMNMEIDDLREHLEAFKSKLDQYFLEKSLGVAVSKMEETQ